MSEHTLLDLTSVHDLLRDAPILRLERTSITRSPKLQVRAFSTGIDNRLALREATVQEYLDLRNQGVDLGLIVVTHTPEGRYLLTDGFHRDEAERRRGVNEQNAYVLEGDEHDAVIYAVLLNGGRGLTFGPEDKRRAAKLYIQAMVAKGVNPSDMDVVRTLGIGRSTVAQARRELDELYDLPRTVQRGGQTSPMTPRPPTRPTAAPEPLPQGVQVERDDEEDDTGGIFSRNDASAFAQTPAPGVQGAQPSWRRNSGGQPPYAAPSSQHAAPRSAPIVAPAPTPGSLTVMITYSYTTANGQPVAGTIPTLDEIEDLPEFVRARLVEVLEGL